MKLKIHKTDNRAVIPTIAYNNTSAGFDIACIEDVVVPSKSSAILPCGLNITVPQGSNAYLMVALRSSWGFKKDLTCHPGIIDEGYTGPLGVKVYNLSNKDIFVKSGDKVAQLILMKKYDIEFEELDDKEFEEFKKTQIRGDGGFGSTN